MSLINCKVELKLQWSKHCVLAVASNDNTDVNPDNIIFTIKHTYMSLLSLYQQKKIKNYENSLANDLENQCIGMNIEQKVRIKIQQMSIDISSNQTV